MIHPTFRRCIFWSHLVVGIVAGLVVLVLGTTGLLMSFETQITHQVEKSMVKAKSKTDGKPLSAAEMVAAFGKSGIEGRPGTLSYSSDADAPVVFAIGRGNQQLFHPVTGESLGKGAEGTRRFFQIALSIHRWLTWPVQRQGQEQAQGQGGPPRGGEGEPRATSWRDIGGQITAAGALAFLFLLVSGLVIWLPKKRVWKAFKAVLTLQPRLKGRARDWNWHNVAGIWASPFILTICLTGIIMAYPWANKALFAVFGETPPQRQEGGGPPGGGEGGGQRNSETAAREAAPREGEAGIQGNAERRERRAPRAEGESGERPRRAEGMASGRGERQGGARGERGARGGRQQATGPLIPVGLDEAIALAKKQLPGWQTISLELRGSEQQPLVVTVSDAGRGRPDRRQKFNLDPGTFAVVKTESFADLKPAGKARQIVRYLHTGEFGGWIGQLLAALTCSAVLLLTWTGFALSFRRFFLKRKAATAKPA